MQARLVSIRTSRNGKERPSCWHSLIQSSRPPTNAAAQKTVHVVRTATPPVIDGDIMTGLGAADDKAGIAAGLLALQRLAADGVDLRGEVVLACVADEEGVSIGTEHLVANHAFDCIGAKSYGMRTAFIDRRKRPFGQTPHQPDLIVGDFAELAAVMAPGRIQAP